MYNNLKYRRGFILSNEEIVVPKHFDTIKIGEYFFSYDKINNICTKYDDNRYLLLLGNIMDVESRTNELDDLAEILINKLISSEEEFIEYLDNLAGRYIIIWGSGKEFKICNDAGAMRSVFYHSERKIVSSHCALIQEITNDDYIDDIKKLKEYSVYCYPGNYSPYKNIKILLPNMLLNGLDMNIKRFWPREDIKEQSIKTVVKKVVEDSQIQVELLLNSRQIITSLTGGADSRTTLAILRKYIEKIKFFTYSRSQSHITNTDNLIVDSIVKNLNLNHEKFSIESKDIGENFEELKSILSKNTFMNHSYILAQQYLNRYSDSDLIHIRSTLYEIGQACFRGSRKISNRFDMNDILTCYSPKSVNDKDVAKIYEEYLKESEMDKIYNYDPYDLLYWEQRMGPWHGQLMNETDIAHDTVVLFNCRRILNNLLSVPLKDRLALTVYKEIIKEEWPVLNFWKINKVGILSKFADSDFDNVGISLDSMKFESGNIYDEARVVPKTIDKSDKRVKFHLTNGDPQKGDFIQSTISINNSKNNDVCYLYIRAPYKNNIVKGKIFYEIYINDLLYIEEDICDYSETNIVKINNIADFSEINLKVRIITRENCSNYSWGKHGRILIERITLVNEETNENVNRITTTSPYSKLV